LKSQKLESQKLESQKLESHTLESQKLESLESQKLESQKLESEARESENLLRAQKTYSVSKENPSRFEKLKKKFQQNSLDSRLLRFQRKILHVLKNSKIAQLNPIPVVTFLTSWRALRVKPRGFVTSWRAF